MTRRCIKSHCVVDTAVQTEKTTSLSVITAVATARGTSPGNKHVQHGTAGTRGTQEWQESPTNTETLHSSLCFFTCRQRACRIYLPLHQVRPLTSCLHRRESSE